jgi:hypothetical protein
MYNRIDSIHKKINEMHSLLSEIRAEMALLYADLNNEALPELETIVVEEDG